MKNRAELCWDRRTSANCARAMYARAQCACVRVAIVTCEGLGDVFDIGCVQRRPSLCLCCGCGLRRTCSAHSAKLRSLRESWPAQGLLSHAAIVSREFGIPCVVSCLNAVERIQSGQRIRVDGDSGKVRMRSVQRSLQRCMLVLNSTQVTLLEAPEAPASPASNSRISREALERSLSRKNSLRNARASDML